MLRFKNTHTFKESQFHSKMQQPKCTKWRNWHCRGYSYLFQVFRHNIELKKHLVMSTTHEYSPQIELTVSLISSR